MKKAEKVQFILDELYKLYPAPKTELDHRNPFELLVATILSAQCTDVRVNMVTPSLFKRCPTSKELSEISQEELEEVIKSINFFRNKARNLRMMAAILEKEHGGQVPEDRTSLEALPGVGRKTANVVLANAFEIPAFAVDTHVHRVANRLGLVKTKTPEETEKAITKVIPREYWIDAHHLLILHGRRVCNARKPKCEICPLREVCRFGQRVA